MLETNENLVNSDGKVFFIPLTDTLSIPNKKLLEQYSVVDLNDLKVTLFPLWLDIHLFDDELKDIILSDEFKVSRKSIEDIICQAVPATFNILLEDKSSFTYQFVFLVLLHNHILTKLKSKYFRLAYFDDYSISSSIHTTPRDVIEQYEISCSSVYIDDDVENEFSLYTKHSDVVIKLRNSDDEIEKMDYQLCKVAVLIKKRISNYLEALFLE